MTEPPIRRDEDLRNLDVPAAITMGMLLPGSARHAMLTDAAIAASHQAEELALGPHPLDFLAGCVRALGISGALELPEPVIGEQRIALVRGWLSAAVGTHRDPADDDLFALWLERVAALLTARRSLTAVRSKPHQTDPQ